jgi:hypothetical protein
MTNNRRIINHTDNHYDIEEIRKDDDGIEVWAVIYCSEDEMTQFTKHDLKVGNHLYFERGELLDDALFAELNNLPFPEWKSKRLAEVNEQIRLIENVTAENQAGYFDPQPRKETALEYWKNADGSWKPFKSWASYPRRSEKPLSAEDVDDNNVGQ